MPWSTCCASTPPEFLFSIKAHRSLTHEPGEDLAAEVRRFREGIAPLAGSGRLAAVLFQFPYSFHYTPDSRRHLAGLCESLRGAAQGRGVPRRRVAAPLGV